MDFFNSLFERVAEANQSQRDAGPISFLVRCMDIDIAVSVSNLPARVPRPFGNPCCKPFSLVGREVVCSKDIASVTVWGNGEWLADSS